jgi:NhaA family Na+:H+ antiporter
MPSSRHPANRLARALRHLLGGDAGAGVLLILVAAGAIGAANSSLADGYHALFHAELPWTPVAKLDTLHLWINDGAMAVFFFVVGLEIKREILQGELSDPMRRRLPVLAAIAGMAAPALVYLLIAGTALPLQRGWAIPAATDIAFAMGVIGLLGKRVPPSLRLFLLTVAIVDDLGAVAIIALFYTAGIKLAWLIAALVVLAGLIAMGRLRIERTWPYLLLAVALWYCVLHSGVHATIAGVAAAFTIPLRIDAHGDSMLLRLEHALVPWNAYAVVPLFGFANAGVAMAGGGLSGLVDPLPLAIAAGLFLGKQSGILGAIVLADRIGFAPRPEGAGWVQIWGTSVLCGIGFTMSLFIGALAFPQYPALVEEAKLGVLAGSLASALLGYAVLRLARPSPSGNLNSSTEQNGSSH